MLFRKDLPDLSRFSCLAETGCFIQNAAPGTLTARFAIRGERSSGTHYIEAVARRFTPLKPVDLGWKHGFDPPDMAPLDDDVVIFVIFRDWPDWIRSMYRKPWHAGRDLHEMGFADFLRAEWTSYELSSLPKEIDEGLTPLPLAADRNPETGDGFKNLLDLRNQKNRAFLGLRERHVKVLYLRLEWLLGNEAPFLAALASTFGLRTRRFRPIRTRFAQQYRSFGWLDRPAPPERFDPVDLDFIRDGLDWTLERQIGYAPPRSSMQ